MRLTSAFSGQGLFARALRGSAITAGAFAGAQALRLASNLILARLLFPEAFGLMALVTVVLVGLGMASDMGVGPAISRSPRGDDPDFLNTAWTLQVIRGALLWAGASALAVPVARFYAAPDLAGLVPVAALSLLIGGFNPTRIDTANRHLLLGRVTALDLVAQAVGLVAMVALAVATGSVWALAIGSVVQSAAKLALCWRYLPGPGNRFRWEPAAGRELVQFGKWILLSTICGFVLSQGDRLVLGAYLPLDRLGLYNIGYFLASFPWLLGGAVTMRVMIPLYRDDPPGTKAANLPRLRKMRAGMTAGLLAMLAVMALIGPWLVGVLYDPRYAAAGAVITLVACAQMPAVVGMTYDQAALAAGDSRAFFWVLLAKALLQSAGFVAGAEIGALTGALAGQGVALTLAHPLIIWLARRHGVWDARHDVMGFGFAAVAIAVALWWNAGAVSGL